MGVIKGNINNNPNVGLFGFNTKKGVLISERLKKNQKHEFEKALGKPIISIRVAGTTLTGVFFAGNNRKVIVPKIILEKEAERLREEGINYEIINTELTALGNVIACNDKGAIISTEFSDEEEKIISKALRVKTAKMDIAGLSSPGAVIVLNGKKGIIHKDASEEEIKKASEILEVELEPATVNLGSPYLKSGIINTEKGFIIGDLSGGPEILHIDETLGYSGN